MARPVAQRVSRELLVVLGLVVLLVAGRFVSGRLGLEWSPSAVRDVVADLGLWGPVLFVGLVTFRQLILIPSQVLLIAGGLCFGIAGGTAYGALGLTFSGCLIFLFTRYVGREAILARVPDELKPVLDAAGRRAGPALVAVGTGYPVGPLSAYHAGAALTGMTLLTFTVAVAAGALVRGVVFTYFGNAITQGMGKELMIAGIVLLVAATLPLASPRARRWFLGRAASRDEDPGPG